MPLTDEDRALIDETVTRRVDAAIAERARQTRKVVQAFLLGLGILVVFLIANGLLSRRSLLVLLHDQIFGYESSVSDMLDRRLSVAYSNHFWLTISDPKQSISFYAHPSQHVEARIGITHQGATDRHNVRVFLDESDDALYDDSEDRGYYHLDLDDAIRAHRHQGERPENVHELIFEIDETGTENSVFLRCLITVRGLELEDDD